MEQQIAYSSFDEKQKQVMKKKLHEWADTVMQGFKKRLRESGRLIQKYTAGEVPLLSNFSFFIDNKTINI